MSFSAKIASSKSCRLSQKKTPGQHLVLQAFPKKHLVSTWSCRPTQLSSFEKNSCLDPAGADRGLFTTELFICSRLHSRLIDVARIARLFLHQRTGLNARHLKRRRVLRVWSAALLEWQDTPVGQRCWANPGPKWVREGEVESLLFYTTLGCKAPHLQPKKVLPSPSGICHDLAPVARTSQAVCSASPRNPPHLSAVEDGARNAADEIGELDLRLSRFGHVGGLANHQA